MNKIIQRLGILSLLILSLMGTGFVISSMAQASTQDVVVTTGNNVVGKAPIVIPTRPEDEAVFRARNSWKMSADILRDNGVLNEANYHIQCNFKDSDDYIVCKPVERKKVPVEYTCGKKLHRVVNGIEVGVPKNVCIRQRWAWVEANFND